MRALWLAFLLFGTSAALAVDCPETRDPDHTYPMTGRHADVWRTFYFCASSENALIDVLYRAGPKMVPSIAEAILDRDMYARRYAISAVGLLRQPEALPVLFQILEDESETDYFRSDALEAIYVIDSGSGQLAAAEILNDPDSPDDLLKRTANEILTEPGRIRTEWKRR